MVNEIKFDPITGDFTVNNAAYGVQYIGYRLAKHGQVASSPYYGEDRHTYGGGDEINGDHLGIDFLPSSYTPTPGAPYSTSSAHLSAHLKGIDTKLSADYLTVLSSGALTAGTVVGLNTSGKAVAIDQTAASTQFTVVGVMINTTTGADQSANVCTEGILTATVGGAGVGIGSPVFVSGASGAMSLTAPTDSYIQMVGTKVSNTTVYIHIQDAGYGVKASSGTAILHRGCPFSILAASALYATIEAGYYEGQDLLLIASSGCTLTVPANAIMNGNFVTTNGWIRFKWNTAATKWIEAGRGHTGSTSSGSNGIDISGYNTASGIASFSSGGSVASPNVASGQGSATIGGNACEASGAYSGSFVGEGNRAQGVDSATLGGNSLTASGKYSASVGGISSRASGEGAASVGGNDILASGVDAVVLGGVKNVASGVSSAVLGGGDRDLTGNGACTASGHSSATIGGIGNEAEADSSVSMGYYGVSRLINEFAHGATVGPGVLRQYRRDLLQGATVDINPVNLTMVDGSLLVLPEYTTWTFEILVVGRESAGVTSAGYRLAGCIYRDAGNSVLLGAIEQTVLYEAAAGFDATATAGGATQDLIVTVTGSASNMYWTAVVNITEVTVPV